MSEMFILIIAVLVGSTISILGYRLLFRYVDNTQRNLSKKVAQGEAELISELITYNKTDFENTEYGIELLKTLPSDYDLIETYLNRIIKRTAIGETVFNPWLILQDFNLARWLALRISPLLKDSNITGICVLGNSGIPLGVLLAQSLEKPLYFYRNEPWTIENKGNPSFIFPEPPENSKLALFDSHITTGFTSAVCYDYLQLKGISVKYIVAPISFLDMDYSDATFGFRKDVEYITLSKGAEHIKTISNLFKVNSLPEAINKISAGHKSKEKNPSSEISIPSRRFRLAAILRSLIGKRYEPKLTLLDERLKQKLQWESSSDDSGIWNLFAKPLLLKEVCHQIGDKLILENYSAMAGTGILGTIFLLALAWHNNYSGMLYSTSNSAGLEVRNMFEKTEDILLVTARMRTGIYVREAVQVLRTYNFDVAKVLVLNLAIEDGTALRRIRTKNMLSKIDAEIIYVS